MVEKQTKESKSRNLKTRKKGMNKGKFGSVRNINGMVYIDFRYLGERVRESSGLSWNEENKEIVRKQLNRIHASMLAGTFRFAEVFPESPHKKYFSMKEQQHFGLKLGPDSVKCSEYFQLWFNRLEENQEVRQRTLRYYKQYLDLYLTPFFGEKYFDCINKTSLYEFYTWARQRNYFAGKPGKKKDLKKKKEKRKTISNTSLNKCIGVLKTICKSAISEYGWSTFYNPFSDYKRLPQDDPYDKIKPFSLEEQKKIINALPDHWKPYFGFAFASGLRQGEQIALKHEDIDWENGKIRIRRARTLNKDNQPFDDVTKNRYSRRDIPIFPIMREILQKQQEINKQFNCEYFFCTPKGNPIDTRNLRYYAWNPVFEKIDVEYRPMIQTRHSFATMALTCGEKPLWVAKILGHRNCEMVINVYSKYVECMDGSQDGNRINELLGS